MNQLRKAVEHLEKVRSAHASEKIEIRCPGRPGVMINATQTGVSGEAIRDGMKVTWQQVTWVVSAQELEKKEIQKVVGMEIIVQERYKFKLAIDKSGAWDYNDPFQIQVVLKGNYAGHV